MSKEIGIDLGTSNVRIFMKGKNIVLDEPSVVAINKLTGEVLTCGKLAKEMLGRTPDNIIAVKPLSDGVIADFEATSMMIKTFIDKVVQKSIFKRPKVIVNLPFNVTDVEERAVEGAIYNAGVRDVYLVEGIMASAIGAKLPIEKTEGSMIVDIGAGITEVAVLSLGGIVTTKSIKLGGNKLDKDIIDYVKNKFNAVISELDSEKAKIQIASAYATMTEDRYIVKGRNLDNGLPVDISLTSKDVTEAIKGSLLEIVNVIKRALEETPPELISDIMDNGIRICGGVASINNIDKYFTELLNVPVYVVTDPLNCSIKGIGMTLDNIDYLKKTKKRRIR